MQDNPTTAAVLIIGNEILSGRTHDKNLNFIALELAQIGVRLKQARIVPDIETDIIEAVNELRKKYDYVFTTGGIGPTHDDITAAAIAKAFGIVLEKNKEAVERLASYYPKDELTEARLRMANAPKGAALIDNPVSLAPGFIIDNVYIMAGVPQIMQAMFANIKPHLKKGVVMQSVEITAMVAESKIAGPLTKLQEKHKKVELGSYPFTKDGKYGVSIVINSTDKQAVDSAKTDVEAMFKIAQQQPESKRW